MPTGGYEGTPSRAGGGLPGGARSVDPGHLLIALGAIMLLVSLFLEWYTPNAEAWDVFEVWDLVLAALAILALMTVAGRLGFGPPRPASWLIAASAAALVIVLYALIDPPPVEQVLAAQRAVLRALRALGVDDEVVGPSGPAAAQGSACSRARVLRPARPS